MKQMQIVKITVIGLLAAWSVPAEASAPSTDDVWTATIERGEATPKRSNKAYAWIPDGCKTVRGVFLTQACMFEAKIVRNPEVRAACTEKHLAIVYAECGIGLRFFSENGATNLVEILRDLSKATGHPELEFAPLITAGHSTAGIFCRNVAYWKPERVAGVIHIMSGNLQGHIEDVTRSLAGVPFLFINGEWEQYGPDGGDLKMGLRSNMGLRTRKATQGDQQQSQSQWICVRQQILARRGKNPDNVMGEVVSRDHTHTRWEPAMFGMVAQFLRSAADLRIPPGDPDGKNVVRCLPVKAEQGWLLDADIKAPKFNPAPYAEFKGEKRYAFWYPDKAMAMKVWEYNQKGWPDPDPTADWPIEKRFAPEANLADLVDSPPAPRLTWVGGDGAWSVEKPAWRDDTGKIVAWNPQAQAIFAGTGGCVRLDGDMACSGLTLGKGYTLAISTNSIKSRASIALDPGSCVDVTLTVKESNGRWGARLYAAGNTTLAGTLTLNGENLKEGTYNIIRASSRSNGEFGKVIAPDGWQAKPVSGSVTLTPIPPAK